MSQMINILARNTNKLTKPTGFQIRFLKLIAQSEEPPVTVMAVKAGNMNGGHYTFANPVTCNILANFHHFSRHFMAEDNRAGHRLVLCFMNVSTAQAAGVHFDEHVTVANFWLRNIFISDIIFTVVNAGFH